MINLTWCSIKIGVKNFTDVDTNQRQSTRSLGKVLGGVRGKAAKFSRFSDTADLK